MSSSPTPPVYPHTLPQPLERLHCAADARRMDAWTIETLGVPGIVLMEHAGRAVAESIAAHLHADPSSAARAAEGAVVVLAGPGNNGGDGWVCARHLWERKIPCIVLSMRPPGELCGDAHLAAEMFVRCARELGWHPPSGDACWEVPAAPEDWCRTLDSVRPSLVVDALFGIGLTRPLIAPCDVIVRHCQARQWPVWSVDMPSGLPSDGAAPKGPAFRAHTCITFGKRKIAHVSEPGKSYCGEVQVADIGLHEMPDAPAEPVWRVPTWRDFSPARETETENAHKGHFGHVGVLAGSPRTAGASQLSAHAALRIGAGLVTKLVSPPLTPDSAFPECMQRDVEDKARLAGLDALVVGPGLGQSAEAQESAKSLLYDAAMRDLPVVIDADALPLCLSLKNLRGVATPHPGEAARLLDSSTQAIQQDRLAAARALQEMSARQGHNLVWVLKGACPIVVVPAGNGLWICDGGNPALAVAGSGDVLAGALGALLAGGMPPEHAALRAVRLHQSAGETLGQHQRRGHFARQIADEMGTIHNGVGVYGI